VEVANVQVDTLKQKCLTLGYCRSEFVGRLVEISIITGRNNYRGIGLLVRKKKQKKKLRRYIKHLLKERPVY
jgi:RNase P protein component